MPMASNELRRIWGVDTDLAFAQLKFGEHFTDDDGMITPMSGYVPTNIDHSAINFLCNEWDYAYRPYRREK
jgi:hypothetical protein